MDHQPQGQYGANQLNPIQYYEQYNLLDPANFFQPDQFPLPQTPGWPYYPHQSLPDDNQFQSKPTTPPPSLYSFTGQSCDQDVVMDGAYLNPPTGPPVVTDAGDLHGMSLAELERLANELMRTPAFDNQFNQPAPPAPVEQTAQLSYSPMSTEPSIFDTSPDLHSWDSPSTVETAPTPSTAASTSSVHVPVQVPPRRSNSSASQYSMSSLGSAPAAIAKRKSTQSVVEKKTRTEDCVAKKLAEDLKRCRSVLPKLAPRPEHPPPVKSKSMHAGAPSRPPTARHCSIKKVRKPTDKPYAPRALSMGEVEMHAEQTDDAHALAMAYFSRGGAPPAATATAPAAPVLARKPATKPVVKQWEVIDLTDSPPESPKTTPAKLPPRAPAGVRAIAPAPARASAAANGATRGNRFQPPALERAPPAPPAATVSPGSGRAMSSTPTYTAPSPEIVVMDASSPVAVSNHWPAEAPNRPTHQPHATHQTYRSPPQSRPSPPDEPMDQSTIKARRSPARLSVTPQPTSSASTTPSPTNPLPTIPPNHPLAGLSIPGPTAPQHTSFPLPLSVDNPSPEALLLAANAKHLPAAQQASLAYLAAAMARGGAPPTSVSAVAAAAVRRGSANSPPGAAAIGMSGVPNWQPFVPLPRGAGSVTSSSGWSTSGYSPSLWSESSVGEEPFRLSGAWLGAKP